ncbi:hypothetical protein llap_20107 [Limosa lapponica baueri]|uniref:Dedicator of cytokinesis TPR repeats region domain-containing protein n=1 Tax=Limosa lapponica baueri TaxID=1758121 RepID=A0A2I0T733_LIMLA|nr:hypothetical protein llap_20107 [Limosa lapponica baueri]
MMVESLLDVLLQTLLTIMSKSQSQEAMSDTHFQHLLDNFQSKDELKVNGQVTQSPGVPPENFLCISEPDENECLSSRLDGDEVAHQQVWNSYFSLAVLFINQPSLQLENATPAKRKKILDKYGDMRVMMAYELFSMWQNLGEHKIHFIPGMIGPFLGVTLVPQPEVRNIMIPIFHDMMDWEQRKNGNFKQLGSGIV